MNRLIGGTIIAFILGMYGLVGIVDIEPGEVGLLVKKIGAGSGMKKETLNTGMHWIDPWRYDAPVYDTRLKQYVEEDIPAQSKDGQPILVDISLEIGLEDDKVPLLHESIGYAWYEQVILPTLRSAIRNETSEHLSDHVYTAEGRKTIQSTVENTIREKGDSYGIHVSLNLRDLSFTDLEFVKTLEKKAEAAQKVIIAQRQAEQAMQDAIKVANIAEGAKQQVIKESEGNRERLRLAGEGERLQKEEQAKGILAIAQAEAEGMRLKAMALSGAGSEGLVSMEWARQLGPNVKVLGYPLGAEGTTGIFNVDGILGDVLKVKGE